ncbi:homeodomain-interacting protein kinase 4-like [Pelodytes ibericus]
MAQLKSPTDCYKVIKVLGRGTFGEVVKGRKRGSGELVAIKILHNDMTRSYITENEIKLLNTLRQVNADKFHFIQFYEHFYDESKCYLVFELLHKNLFEYQKEIGFAPLPVRHIRTITAQVLKSLSKLKELSIMHTDLKPENIMLVDQKRYPFRVKVIDFGCSIIFSEVRNMKELYIQSRFYRAPEIILGLPFCEKVDMWSLGCIIAELHLGCPLYPGSSQYDQIRYICETQGLPSSYLLNAASKAPLFFKMKAESPGGTKWELKTVDEFQMQSKVKPLETRQYMLKSLDEIELVHYPDLDWQDADVIDEYYERKKMVQLIKRMLTWDSHKRITPKAAMKHPFFTVPLSTREHTYAHREIRQDKNYLSPVQRTIEKMDDLCLTESPDVTRLTAWSVFVEKDPTCERGCDLTNINFIGKQTPPDISVSPAEQMSGENDIEEIDAVDSCKSNCAEVGHYEEDNAERAAPNPQQSAPQDTAQIILDLFRVRRAAKVPQESPRDVVVKLRSTTDKLSLLAISRKHRELLFENITLQIFEDLPPITVGWRRSMAPLTAHLRSINAKYRWGLAHSLTVHNDDKLLTIENMEDPLTFLTALDFPHLPNRPREPDLRCSSGHTACTKPLSSHALSAEGGM